MLTAKGSQENKVKGLKYGINDYLGKPFNFDELHLKVANILKYQESLKEYHYNALKGEPDHPDMEKNPLLDKIYQIIENHISNSQLSVEWLANELAVSSRTLNRKLKSIIGLSTNEVIRNYRLKQSKKLLLSGQNVSQVAYRIGFDSPSYFGQCFKDLYAQSPKDFALKHGIVI